MMQQLNDLFPYEFDALLDALRRDLRSQQTLAGSEQDWAEWHGINAKMVCRLLEILNPKSPEPPATRHIELPRPCVGIIDPVDKSRAQAVREATECMVT